MNKINITKVNKYYNETCYGAKRIKRIKKNERKSDVLLDVLNKKGVLPFFFFKMILGTFKKKKFRGNVHTQKELKTISAIYPIYIYRC